MASFVPAAARPAFWSTYGPVDDTTWRLARFKALFSAVMVMPYAADVGDMALLQEAQPMLRYLLE